MSGLVRVPLFARSGELGVALGMYASTKIPPICVLTAHDAPQDPRPRPRPPYPRTGWMESWPRKPGAAAPPPPEPPATTKPRSQPPCQNPRTRQKLLHAHFQPHAQCTHTRVVLIQQRSELQLRLLLAQHQHLSCIILLNGTRLGEMSAALRGTRNVARMLPS